MDGDDVSAFALTYRKMMTGELGHLKVEGYEYWESFRVQCMTRFARTHEEEWALAAMEKVQYKNDIGRFLLEMENYNTYVGLSGVALRQLLSRSIPKEALRRLSVQEYEKDEDWVAALREVTRREEIFNEELSLRHDHGSGSKESGGGKRKTEESKATTKPKRQRKEYTAEEKAAYKLKKESERKGKNNAPVKGKIINTDWKTAHNGIRESVTNDQKSAQ